MWFLIALLAFLLIVFLVARAVARGQGAIQNVALQQGHNTSLPDGGAGARELGGAGSGWGNRADGGLDGSSRGAIGGDARGHRLTMKGANHALVLTCAALSLTACGGAGEQATAPTASTTSSAAVPSPSATKPPATPSPKPSKPVAKAKSVYWESLKPGMCVRLPEKDEAINMTVTDCRAEHDAEVSLRSRLEGGHNYPGDQKIDAAAEKICEKALESYVGKAYNESQLDWDYVSPARDAWGDGSRRLICMVFDPEAETTSVPFKGSEL